MSLKFIYSEKATKILRNLPLTFDYSAYSQKLGEDFAKFCGLLRIYELYIHIPNIYLGLGFEFSLRVSIVRDSRYELRVPMYQEQGQCSH